MSLWIGGIWGRFGGMQGDEGYKTLCLTELGIHFLDIHQLTLCVSALHGRAVSCITVWWFLSFGFLNWCHNLKTVFCVTKCFLFNLWASSREGNKSNALEMWPRAYDWQSNRPWETIHSWHFATCRNTQTAFTRFCSHHSLLQPAFSLGQTTFVCNGQQLLQGLLTGHKQRMSDSWLQIPGNTTEEGL